MVSILAVRKLLFFAFIRNRIVLILCKNCGKTRESPVKYKLVGFSLMY